MWVINFWLKPECVTEKIKSLNVRLINYKTHGNCIWIKRRKTGKNYAKTIIARHKMLAYRAQLNFQTAHIIKAADTVS